MINNLHRGNLKSMRNMQQSPVLFTLSIVLCIQCAWPKKHTVSPSVLGESIENYMKPYLVNRDFAGVIKMVKNDSVIFEKAYGMADLEHSTANSVTTKFRISSISKTFTAAMFILLQEKGKLSLKDPVAKYIPDYPNGNIIHIEHLLDHISGIPDYNYFNDYDQMMNTKHSLPDMVDWFKDKPLEFTPGTADNYTNSGYCLAAYVLEKITGKDYRTNLQELILSRLELNNTGLDEKNINLENKAKGYSTKGINDLMLAKNYFIENKLGSGSMYSTVDDIYIWTRAVLTSQLFDIKKQTPLGWAVRNYFKRDLVEQDGQSPGFISYTSYYPKENLYIIYLANVDAMAFRKMRTDLAAIYFSEPFTAPVIRDVSAKFETTLMNTIPGEYAFAPNWHFTITNKDSNLIFKWVNRSTTEQLVPFAPDKVSIRSSGAVMTLKEAGTNQQYIHWYEHGYEAVCKMVK